MLGSFFLLWQMVDIYRQRGHRVSLRVLWPHLVVLGMCLWLMKMASSSTALVCLIAGTAIFFCARLAWVKTNLNNLGWCVLGLGLFMAVFSVSEEFRGMIAGLVGRNATLTDRTLIWDELLKSGSNPVIGEGFESYWLTRKGAKVVDEFHVTYAHNGYLDQISGHGLDRRSFVLGNAICGRTKCRQPFQRRIPAGLSHPRSAQYGRGREKRILISE